MHQVTEEQVTKEILGLKKIRLELIENDKRFVRSRNSSTFEPFPPGGFDKLKRSNIWETVLLQYLDPSSLTSAYSCCLTFRNISEKSVLVQVLSFLKQQRTLVLKPIPLRLRFRCPSWNHDIWKLRLISKSWKQAVQHVYLNEYSSPTWYFNFPRVEYADEHPFMVDLDDTVETLGAHWILQSNNSSAFRMLMLQVVHIRLFNVNMYAQGFIMNYDYGNYIRGLYYEVDALLSREDQYLIFLIVVQKMPNLKWIELTLNMISASQPGAMSDCLLANPFPTIPSLELIRFNHRELDDSLIIDEILRTNTHIKSLMLPYNHSVSDSVQLENCTQLEQYNVSISPHVSQVLCLSSVNWPLKHLSIKCTILFSTIHLFRMINRFGNTLEFLEVKFVPKNITRNNCILELPKLKQISFLQDDRYPWTSALDFLLPCRSLEEIGLGKVSSASASEQNNLEPEPVVQFHGFVERLEESNIWRWFPRLKLLEIEKYNGLSDQRVKYIRIGLRTVIRMTNEIIVPPMELD